MLQKSEVTEVYHPATETSYEYRSFFIDANCIPENIRAMIVTYPDDYAVTTFQPYKVFSPSKGLSAKLYRAKNLTDAIALAYANMTNEARV